MIGLLSRGGLPSSSALLGATRRSRSQVHRGQQQGARSSGASNPTPCLRRWHHQASRPGQVSLVPLLRRLRLEPSQASGGSAQAPYDGLPGADDDYDELLEEEEGEELLDDEAEDAAGFSLPDEGEGEDDEFEQPTQEEFDKLQEAFGYGDDGGEEELRQERLRMAQEAASSGSGGSGSSQGRYPEPEERGYYLSDLFFKAAYIDAAVIMEHDFPDATTYGLQSDPDKIIEGDMYVCMADSPEDDVAALVHRALENGATSLLLPSLSRELDDLGLPEGTPCHYVMSVQEVADRLAVAFYDAPSRDLLVVGVVGAQGRGKTTVSWLVCGILEAMEQVTGTLNSAGYSLCGDLLDVDGDLYVAPDDDVANEIESSSPFRVTPYHPDRYEVLETTPNGMQLHKLLAGVRDRGASCAVVECSTSALQAGHCRFLELSVAVHLDIVNLEVEDTAEQEALREAQLEVFDTLLDSTSQAAVINIDDLYAPLVVERTGAMPIVTYSFNNETADVYLESSRYSIWESDIVVHTPQGKLQIITPLLGRYNVRSVLAAVAVGIALKVPLPQIVAGIEAVEVIPGRCEVIDEGQPFSVVVDGSDTPEKLEELLSELRQRCGAKNIWTVLGCRGEEDRAVRVQMMEVADALSDFVIVTNDSPRREAPEQIAADLVSGLPDELLSKYSRYVYFPFQDQGHVPLWFEAYLQKAQRLAGRYVMEDRFSAIRCAIGTAGPEDVVVIAGRGARDYMEYWDGESGIVKGWFDDRVEARNALQKLSILAQLDGKLDRSSLPWMLEEDGKDDGLDWDDDDDMSDDDD